MNKGHVNIQRQDSDDGSQAHITIVDALTGIEVCTAILTMGDLALALTGLGHRPAQYQLAQVPADSVIRPHNEECDVCGDMTWAGAEPACEHMVWLRQGKESKNGT